MAFKPKSFTIDEVRDMADKRTGRVLMIIDRVFAPYEKGKKASFTPEIALTHYNDGVARFALFPDAQYIKPANPGEDPVKATATKPAEAVTSKAVAAFRLPADWQRRDAIQKRFYASKIKGVPAGDVGTDAEIEKILEDYAKTKNKD